MALLFLSLVLLAGLGAIGTLIFGLVLKEEKILREYLKGHTEDVDVPNTDQEYMFDAEFCTLHGDWKPCIYCNQQVQDDDKDPIQDEFDRNWGHEGSCPLSPCICGL